MFIYRYITKFINVLNDNKRNRLYNEHDNEELNE